MEPLRTYIDTSVFGGYYDDEFAKMTRPFFELIFAKKLIPLLSDILIAEITDAPPHVRGLLNQVLPLGEQLPVTPAVIYLQKAYLRNGVVPARNINDALHVAQATVARAQVLASWNFKHMLPPNRTRLFNGVNLAEGFGLLVIMSPYDIVESFDIGEVDSNEKG